MPIPVHKLYKIDGDDPAGMERVRRSMDWLLSPTGEGLAEALLRSSYARHGKPLYILVSNWKDFAFLTQDGFPAIVADMNYLDHDSDVLVKGADGQYHRPSLEEVLVHELTHATDDFAKSGPVSRYYRKLHSEKMKAFFASPEQQQHFAYARNTPYVFEANKHINTHLDEGLALERELVKEKLADPEFEFVRQTEYPAIANQNKICQIKGDPERIEAYGETGLDNAMEREEFIQHLQKECGVQSKLGIPPLAHTKPDSWQDFVKEPEKLTASKWTPNAYEHPLIAKHEEGGRNS